MNFAEVPINNGDAFSHGVDDKSVPLIVTPPTDDLYFFSVSAMLNTHMPLNITLNSPGISVGMSLTSTAHDSYDTSGFNSLLALDAGTEVTLSYKGYLWCCSRNSWSGFGLTGVMNSIDAFSVATETQWTNQGQLQYDVILAHNSSSYDVERSEFKATVSGLYYFYMSTSVFGGGKVRLELRKNGWPVAELRRASTTHNGTDSMSSGILLRLATGDKVTVYLKEGELHSSVKYKETSFLGFLYSPRGRHVAWTLLRTRSLSGDSEDWDHVTFDVVKVLEGATVENSVLLIPQTGYYFIHITVGAAAGRRCLVSMYVNGILARYVGVFRGSQTHSGVDTLSAGSVYRLEEGDRVSVSALLSGNHTVYSDRLGLTKFVGFLLLEQ